MDIKWPVSDADIYRINGGVIIEVENKNKLEDEFYAYALKFKKSANILTKHLLENSDIRKLDIYFFSVAYLYRHSIELVLKAIGFKYIITLEDRKAFIKDTFHNLSEILQSLLPFIRYLIKRDVEAYDWLVEYFGDINLIDKESDSFRYPFGISVKKEESISGIIRRFQIKPVFEKQTHINLVNFANKFEVAFDLLDSLYQKNFGRSMHYKKYKPIFLEEGGGYYAQSVVGYEYNSNKFHPYVRAYTESAEYFYEKIIEDNSMKEILFIPMCYLYRNATELSLKETLYEECSFNFQEALKHINKKKHKVLGIWNLIKAEIKEHAKAPKEDVTIANVENYINQLNNIDGSSDKFRYPTNKHLELHFKKKRKFDIRNINDFFGELLSFLSSVNMMMAVQNEWKAEMEAEHRSEMEFYNDYSDYE